MFHQGKIILAENIIVSQIKVVLIRKIYLRKNYDF